MTRHSSHPPRRQQQPMLPAAFLIGERRDVKQESPFYGDGICGRRSLNQERLADRKR